MQTSVQIADGLHWVGANDRRLSRFENIFPLPNGISYNSYMILDEKTCLMDTIDEGFIEYLVENVTALLAGRKLDYIVVTHMEPDHAAGIQRLLDAHPGCQVVGNAKMRTLINQFFPIDITPRFHEIKEGDTLNLGRRTLQFLAAPMVHWPEVMFAYEQADGVLFTSDAFGTFGALSGNVFADEVDFENEFLDEARRYYANIVGKYGVQVQMALKKTAALDTKMICPLHGPVWRGNLDWYCEKYDLWSRYEPEEKGVLVAYGSMYGHTRVAAEVLAAMLGERGVGNIRLYDISKTHVSYLTSEIFHYSHLVLAAPTYNMGIYLPMETLLHDMEALTLRNRKVAIIGNGSWAPEGPKLMKERVQKMKDMELLAEPLVVLSALKAEQLPAMGELADTIATSVKS